MLLHPTIMSPKPPIASSLPVCLLTCVCALSPLLLFLCWARGTWRRVFQVPRESIKLPESFSMLKVQKTWKNRSKPKSMKDGGRSLSSCPGRRSTHLETHTWAQQVTLRVNLRTWGWWEESQLLFTLSKQADHRLSCFQHFSTKLQLLFIQPVQAEMNLAFYQGWLSMFWKWPQLY